MVSPVLPTNEVKLVQGDDYAAADGRALVWTTSDESTWPDLEGAELTFRMRGLELEVAIVEASGASKQIQLELTSEQTDALSPTAFEYQIDAILANDHNVTLVEGVVSVKRNV